MSKSHGGVLHTCSQAATITPSTLRVESVAWRDVVGKASESLRCERSAVCGGARPVVMGGGAVHVQCVRFIDHNSDLLPEFLVQHGPLQLTRFVCAELEGVCDEAQTPPMELFDAEMLHSVHDDDDYGQGVFGFDLDQDFPDMDDAGLWSAHEEL